MVSQHDAAVPVLGAHLNDLLGRELAAGARGIAVAMHFNLIFILLGKRSYKLAYHKRPSFLRVGVLPRGGDADVSATAISPLSEIV